MYAPRPLPLGLYMCEFIDRVCVSLNEERKKAERKKNTTTEAKSRLSCLLQDMSSSSLIYVPSQGAKSCLRARYIL